MLRRRLIFALGAAGVVAACTDSTGPPPAQEVEATVREESSLHGLRWQADTDLSGTHAVPAPASGLSSTSAQPALSVSEAGLTASFWAVRGEDRYLQVNYGGSQDGGGEWEDDDDDGARGWRVGIGAPLLRLTIPRLALARYPDGSRFSRRDSVLVTVTIDAGRLRVELEPDGLTFGKRHPATLQIWYGAVGGDFNGDGRVDAEDAYIEAHLLSLWERDDAGGVWHRLPADHSLEEKWFRAELRHFSGYEVSW